MTFWQKWAPTNKWWVATATSAGTIVAMFWVGNGVDSDDEKLVLIGIVVQRVVAYIARNEPEAQVVTVNNTFHGSPPDVEERDRDTKGRFSRKSVIEPEPS